MARRTLNRRYLREVADQAQADTSGLARPKEPTKAKVKKSPAPGRKSRAKKAPPRMCAHWGIFDAGMKQVAIFNYNQRNAADAMLADLLARKKSPHFLQIVKLPMPEAVPFEPSPLT
jgi:hypothetical protein